MLKRKILVVDDERDFTQMLKYLLDDVCHNYETMVENDSSRAVMSALVFRPDVIFLDVIMPGIEGPDVLNQLQNNDELKGIPIVFLTATVTKQEVEAHNGMIGGHTFIAKPVSLGELIDCIDRNISLPPDKLLPPQFRLSY